MVLEGIGTMEGWDSTTEALQDFFEEDFGDYLLVFASDCI